MIGSQELILILVIILIVFGPKRVPEMAKELGRAIQAFKKASANIADVTTLALKDDEDESEIVANVATNLAIETKGKSTKQLIEEIGRKTVKNMEDADIHENR